MDTKYTDITVITSLLKRFEDGYYFYKEGRIYRTRKKVNQFKEIILDDPEIVSHLTKRGYRRLALHQNGSSIYVYEHRLIYAYFYGIDALYSHQCIDHINGDKGDNRIENLRGLSVSENTLQAEKMGRFKRTYGEINGMCKLSSEDISRIRESYKNPYNQYELSELFGVSQSHISNILNRKSRTIS